MGCFTLLGVNLFSSVGDHDVEEFSSLNTKKKHFSGLRDMCSRIALNTLYRWVKWSFVFDDLMTMSSIYSSIMSFLSSLKSLSIRCWYVGSTFFRPKGMTL